MLDANEGTMTISIALATYNGERYIREQLDSFAAQTLLPDELVICDDCSGDNTLAVIENFAQSAEFKIRFHRNERQLGFARNFEKALSLCDGDLIFLSDQDDVWFPEKLQIVRNVFVSYPRVQVVINDTELADAQLNPSGMTQFSNIKRAGLNKSLFVTGCCTTITKNWRDFVLPIPTTHAVHDRWINMTSHYTDKRIVLERSLQYFRRHSSNVSDWVLTRTKPPSLSNLNIANILTDSSPEWAKTLLLLRLLDKRLAERLPQTLECADAHFSMRRIENEIRLLESRIRAVSKPRLQRVPSILGLLASGSYNTARGWKSALRDLLASRANLPAALITETEQI
jgi:glycosyltransferase involved in cell wall biosynthesis